MTIPAEGIKQLYLDGQLLELAGTGIPFTDLARWQSKILFGDPSKDDNELLSSWQQSDFSGGHGVYDMKEGTDTQRFHFGTIYGRFPSAITKPPYLLHNGAGGLEGTGNKHVLGEMWSDTIGDFLVIYTAGSGVRRGLIDGALGGQIFTGVGVDEVCNTLANGVPTGPGCAFQGEHTEEVFFIPQGNAGYATLIDTGTSLVEDAAFRFQTFAVWDNKLVGVTTGGRIYKCTDPDFGGAGPNWVLYDVTYALSKSYRIRKIINYYDRRDEPCLFIITDRDMWQFDPDGPELFRIDLGWASHKYHGKAACVWNGQLFIAVGMAVFRYTSGAWMPVGLDRDDGLPSEYQGHIVELCAGQNGIYALVQGQETDSVYGSKSSIHEFNGTGWQCIWTDDTAVPASIQYHATLATTAFTVTGMCVTQSGISTASKAISTLVFSTAGSDDHMYTMPLQATMSNPRAEIGHGQYFGQGMYYYLETCEFDADMLGYIKIANAMQFYLEEPVAIATPSQRDTFKILCRLDKGMWELCWTGFAIPGRYVAAFGNAIGEALLTAGESWEKIQFRFEIHRAGSYNADKPMVLTNTAFSFLKTVSSNFSFNFSVITKMGNPTKTPRELRDWLDDLTSYKRWALMTISGQEYKVFVSQNQGVIGEADTQDGFRSLAVVQIPQVL